MKYHNKVSPNNSQMSVARGSVLLIRYPWTFINKVLNGRRDGTMISNKSGKEIGLILMGLLCFAGGINLLFRAWHPNASGQVMMTAKSDQIYYISRSEAQGQGLLLVIGGGAGFIYGLSRMRLL